MGKDMYMSSKPDLWPQHGQKM